MFSGDLPSPSAGWNMKACEMNAAFGLAQLKKLEHFKAAGWVGWGGISGLAFGEVAEKSPGNKMK